MSRLQDAIILKGVHQTLLKWSRALQGQRTLFPQGKRAPTDPPLTAEICLQTIHLLASQLTVYTDGSVTTGTRDGSAGIIVTYGNTSILPSDIKSS